MYYDQSSLLLKIDILLFYWKFNNGSHHMHRITKKTLLIIEDEAKHLNKSTSTTDSKFSDE
jgi:hypothetical protein